MLWGRTHQRCGGLTDDVGEDWPFFRGTIQWRKETDCWCGRTNWLCGEGLNIDWGRIDRRCGRQKNVWRTDHCEEGLTGYVGKDWQMIWGMIDHWCGGLTNDVGKDCILMKGDWLMMGRTDCWCGGTDWWCGDELTVDVGEQTIDVGQNWPLMWGGQLIMWGPS